MASELVEGDKQRERDTGDSAPPVSGWAAGDLWSTLPTADTVNGIVYYAHAPTLVGSGSYYKLNYL